MDAAKAPKPANSGMSSGMSLANAPPPSASLQSSHSSNSIVSGDDAKAATAPSSSPSKAPATASSPASGGENESAVAAPVTAASLLEGIKAHSEWAKALLFDSHGTVIAATVTPQDGEMEALLRLFDKREDTIASGIVLLTEQYDVHRFHPPLIYGRRGDPTQEDGEGIAVCRVTHTEDPTRVLFGLITYVYPTLSARAVPQLKEFCETQLANLS